jgi:hypothetical protein
MTHPSSPYAALENRGGQEESASVAEADVVELEASETAADRAQAWRRYFADHSAEAKAAHAQAAELIQAGDMDTLGGRVASDAARHGAAAAAVVRATFQRR